MIRHIVMYRLNEPSEENKLALIDKFMSMKGKIPYLLDIETGIDCLGSERSFEVCLNTTFESMDTLDKYRVHPYHMEIVEYVKGVVKQSVCADYEF